jgi:radical SAM-linked protein
MVATVSHAEALRTWEEALSGSGLPVATTEGRRPRPRFAVVAPLPQGYTSDCERLELLLTEPVDPADITHALNQRLPQGWRALACAALPAVGPSLQSQVCWAEYRITLGPYEAHELETRIDAFFRSPSVPWEEAIEGKVKRFDLRQLVDDLWVEQSEGGTALGMRLDASTTGTGRPDSVVATLGLPQPLLRHRTRLLFAHMPEANLRWRRSGRFENPGREP